jgi:CubicO group peptidase (beta-lactamase class C family)
MVQVSLFGADAAKITVGHILRMESGVQDFDQPAFDAQILTKEGYQKHSPLEFVEFAANQTVKLLFEPGTQVGCAEHGVGAIRRVYVALLVLVLAWICTGRQRETAH